MADLGNPLEIPLICLETLGSGGQNIRHGRPDPKDKANILNQQ